MRQIRPAPVPSTPKKSVDLQANRGDGGALKGAGELTDLPEWQRAFILRPNVRFTRTPENSIPRKGAEGELIGESEIGLEVHLDASVGSVEQAAPVVEPSIISVATPVVEEPQVSLIQSVPPVEQPVVWQGDAMSLLAKLRREVAGTLRHREAADALGLSPQPEPLVKLVETPAVGPVEAAPVRQSAASAPMVSMPVVQPAQSVPAAETSSQAAPALNALPDSIFWMAIAEDIDLSLFAGFGSDSPAKIGTEEACPSRLLPPPRRSFRHRCFRRPLRPLHPCPPGRGGTETARLAETGACRSAD